MAKSQPFTRELTLVDAAHVVSERIRSVLIATTVVFLALCVLILTEEPVYRAYVTLAPSAPLVDPTPKLMADSLLGGSDNLGAFQSRTSTNHAFALLQSRAISRRLIESENLMPTLFADQWDIEKQTWRARDIDSQPTLADALDLFESEVRFVSKDASTGFIRINIEWTEPELAANWANRLVEIADDAIREQDISEARQSIQFLERQLEDSSVESVKQLIYELIESHAKTILVASVEDNYVFSVIDSAVAPQHDETINMPVSFKMSLALIFAFCCGALWVIVAAQFNKRSV